MYQVRSLGLIANKLKQTEIINLKLNSSTLLSLTPNRQISLHTRTFSKVNLQYFSRITTRAKHYKKGANK